MRQLHITAFFGLAIFTSVAVAQTEHGHSDVEFSYVQNAIEIEPSAEGYVFEGEFGTGAFSRTATEPGFASEPEEGLGIGADDLIAFNVLEPLSYWNGTEFLPAGDTTITIAGVGGAADVIVSATSSIQLADFSTPSNLIDQADGDGEFHSDLSFEISEGAPIGGYGLVFSLSSNAEGLADSEPFGIFLNFGELDEEMFESGVEAFGAVVPEPNSWSLGLAALLLAPAFRRRESNRRTKLGSKAS